MPDPQGERASSARALLARALSLSLSLSLSLALSLPTERGLERTEFAAEERAASRGVSSRAGAEVPEAVSNEKEKEEGTKTARAQNTGEL